MIKFLSIFILTTCATVLNPLQAAEIPNGGMEHNLSEWKTENQGSIALDRNVKQDGNASMVLTSPEGAKDSKAVLLVPATGGTFTLTGHIKAEGKGLGGALGLLAIAKSGQPVGGWQHISNIHAHDWKPFSKEITLPANTGKFMIILTVNGGGKVWLDNLSGGGDNNASSSSVTTLPQEDVNKYNGPIPVVTNIGAVKDNIICVTLRERKRTYGKLVPYQKQDGDKIVEGKIHKDGTPFERKIKRNGKDAGLLVGPDNKLHHQVGKDGVTGKPLHRNNALNPETWTLSGKSATGIKPTAVALKQKPLGGAGKQMRDCWYVLTFDKPLTVGEQYSLDFGQLGMKETFTFNPKQMRSEAVYVSHIGYRPSDTAKFGFLSYWSGTGGSINYQAGKHFALLDAKTRQEVFTGKTKLRMGKAKASYGYHAKGRNYALSDVYSCDFSEFKKPGDYVLYIDGIGCSHPFPIHRDAWTTAAKVSLRGFFHQRAGQEWKKPWADWEQPLAYHPDNGEEYWELSKSQMDIVLEMGKRHEDVMSSGKFDEWKTGKKVANAWGGYYDAGDFDRHTRHLICSRNMLELMELFPEYYASVKLPLPEASNDLPDLFDEALWAIDFYKRIQRADGAIYGGIETNGHPKPGEPAWLCSLTRYVFAPDPRSCWRYAASAARAAFIFKQLGKTKESADYLDSAVRAMNWGEKEYHSKKAYFEKSKSWWNIKDFRNLAALAIYRMNQDQTMLEVFEETCIFLDQPITMEWRKGAQEEAALIYARMPDDLINADVKKNAIAGIETTAQKQITYSDGIPYMWTGPNGDPGFPLILSINAAPQGQPLCRAYSLTGKQKYLDYAIKTSLFSVGANPQNMTFTTGLGYKAPEFPLQCTTTAMHQTKPYAGYTVYGLSHMGNPPQWITQWFVTKDVTAPINMNAWPISESYWDVESWPLMNENTVQQSMAPAIYVWGYLAGRK